MALKYQTITIDLSRGGLRTDVDPKAMTPGELILLENGVFDKRGAINKRKGNRVLDRTPTVGAAYVGGQAMAVRNDVELIVVGQEQSSLPRTSRAFSRSVEKDVWREIGTIHPVEVESNTVTQQYTNVARPNVARVSQRYLFYAAQRHPDALLGNPDAVVVSIHDETTGTRIWEGELTDTERRFPNPVAIGAKALLWVGQGGGGNLKAFKWDSDAPGTAPSAAAAITAVLASDAGGLRIWDTCEWSDTECIVAFKTTANAITVARVTSAGVITGGTVPIAENPRSLTVFKVNDGTSDRVCVAWQVSASANVNYAVYDGSLVQVTAPGLGFADSIADQVVNITGATVIEGATNKVRLFCDRKHQNNASDFSMVVVTGTVPAFSGGSTAVLQTFNHVALASKAFTHSNAAYVWTTHHTQLLDGNGVVQRPVQPTYFLMSVGAAFDSVTVPTTHAKALYGRARMYEANAGTQYGISNIASMGDDRWLCAVVRRERNLKARTDYSLFPSVATRTVAALTADMSPNAPLSVGASEALIMGGGHLAHFDGRLQEYGFHLFPEVFTVADTGAGGGLVASTKYSWCWVAEWTDRQGLMHRSAPSVPGSHTTGVGITKVDLTLRSLATVAGWTDAVLKAMRVVIHLYRTKAGGGGLYYKTGLSVVNDPSVVNLTLSDGESDTTISTNEILYTDGGVVEVIGPPPMLSFALGSNRIFGIPSDDRTAVWYTAAKVAGTAYEWSDLLTLRLEADGPNTALAFDDDKLFVFKERAVYAVAGTGANALGVGQFSEPYRLPGDIGCVDRASVLVTPAGIIFKSAKGFWALGKGRVGAPVEQYDRYAVKAAVLEKDSHRAVFFLSDRQPALVWDYETGQWGTYTAHEGVAAAVWQGKLTWLDEDGGVHQRTDDYLDDGDPYGLKLGLGWITMAGALGWQRFRKVGVLCDWKSPHTLMLRAYYRRGEVPEDRGTVVTGADGVEAVRFDLALDASSVKGGHLMATRLPHQKATAIRLEIEDTDPTGEDYSITAVMLEVGIRPGFAHLSPAKTA